MYHSTMLYSKRYPMEQEADRAEPICAEERAETEAKLREFWQQMQSICYIELPERKAGAQKFIDSAIKLSESFVIDIDIEKKDFEIQVVLYMYCSAYPDAMTRMLAELFSMSDTSASFILPDTPGDFALMLNYRTHDSYINGKKLYG